MPAIKCCLAIWAFIYRILCCCFRCRNRAVNPEPVPAVEIDGYLVPNDNAVDEIPPVRTPVVHQPRTNPRTNPRANRRQQLMNGPAVLNFNDTLETIENGLNSPIMLKDLADDPIKVSLK